MSLARFVIVAAVALSGWRAFAQAPTAPVNDGHGDRDGWYARRANHSRIIPRAG